MEREKFNIIKEVLVRKDRSQKWLAQQMGRTPNTIASICNNKSQPNMRDLFRIAELLDVDPSELLVRVKKAPMAW